MATDYFNTTGCLALVRREHAAFYRRVFGAIEMSDTRPYPGLAFPVVLYHSNAAVNLQQIYARFPFFRSTLSEQEQLFSEVDLSGYETPVQTTSRAAFQQAIARVAAE